MHAEIDHRLTQSRDGQNSKQDNGDGNFIRTFQCGERTHKRARSATVGQAEEH